MCFLKVFIPCRDGILPLADHSLPEVISHLNSGLLHLILFDRILLSTNIYWRD